MTDEERTARKEERRRAYRLREKERSRRAYCRIKADRVALAAAYEKNRRWRRMRGILSWSERRAAGLVYTEEQRRERNREYQRLYQEKNGERLRELARVNRQKAKALGYRKKRTFEKKRSLAEGAACRYLRSIGLIERGESKTMQARRAALAYAREIGLL